MGLRLSASQLIHVKSTFTLKIQVVPGSKWVAAIVKALVRIVDCVLDFFDVHGDYFDNTFMVGVWSLAVLDNSILGCSCFA